ncbi:MAG TPA: type II secretion system F family protein [Acidobacteriota bacterium]|nr:type II secretion system F family protein [Acidobacteriota bacterium]
MYVIILAVVIGLLVFVAAFTGFYALSIRSLELSGRLGSRPVTKGKGLRHYFLQTTENVIKPLGEMLPRPPSDMSKMEKRLVTAGIRRKDAVYLFYGVQVSLAIALLLVFAVTGYLTSAPLLYSILAVFLGALLPDLWLQWKGTRRKDQIELGLPDALDLLVVCVEAGLGLDQSLMRISEEIRQAHPALSSELQLYSLEVNAGRSRASALRNLGERSGVDDLRALAAVLIQTDRFGTSIAQSLRAFSDTMRTKRRQRAEERAAKMGVKMIPPMVLFVFPSIFVVVIGPAIIGLVKVLLPFLKQQ